MELKSTLEKVSTLTKTFGKDPGYCSITDYDSISDDGILYQDEDPLFFESIRDTESTPLIAAKEEVTSTKAGLRMDSQEDEEFSFEYPGESSEHQSNCIDHFISPIPAEQDNTNIRAHLRMDSQEDEEFIFEYPGESSEHQSNCSDYFISPVPAEKDNTNIRAHLRLDAREDNVFSFEYPEESSKHQSNCVDYFISPLPAEENTTINTDLRLDAKEDEEFSYKFSDESEDVSTVSSFQINAKEGKFCGFDDLALLGQSEEAWQQRVLNPFALASSYSEKKLKLEADGVWQQEVIESFDCDDPTDSCSVSTSYQPVDPASLPIVKVLLQRLPEHLLYCKSIKMTKDCATLDVSDTSPDFVINFCSTCRRMHADRQKLFIPKECLICRTSLVYMCTKCHHNYYVNYDSMVHHWLACKNANLANVKINPMALIRQLEDAKNNVKKEPLMSSGEIKSSGKAVLRLLTAKVVVDKLPESVVKSKRVIQNKDFLVGTEIKSKEMFKRYCPKCKNITMNSNNIDQLKICEKCSSLLQYMCTSCNDCYFFNYFNLKEHRRFCKPMDQWDDFSVVFYRCLVCDFKTEREFSMVSHLETTQHSRDGTMQTAEAFDKSTFVNEQHAIDMSKKTKRYCPKCRILVPSARNKDHCPKCDTRLFYHCIKCGEKKASRRMMHQHLWTKCHSNRYQCVLCDFAASTWNMMQKHLSRRHISKQFHCDSCTFRAKKKKDLQRHVIKGHLKVEPVVKIDKNNFDADVSQSWRDYSGIMS